MVDIPTHRLLRRHVLGRPDGLRRLCEPQGGLEHPCQAEVCKDRSAFLVEKDVGGLKVPMNNRLGVRVVERVGQWAHVH